MLTNAEAYRQKDLTREAKMLAAIPTRLGGGMMAHGELAPSEEFTHDNRNWTDSTARISIIIPSYRYDSSRLLRALENCSSTKCMEIVVYDDGSCDSGLLAQTRATAEDLSVPVRVVSCAVNKGRSKARNAAIVHARAEWILLLDADMLPDTANFVENYIAAIDSAKEPRLVVGGFSLKFAPNNKETALHRWQATNSECRSSRVRQESPARYVFSSNVLAHRNVLRAISFEEAFVGWGMEDTDWGIRVSLEFPIQHIDNTATHLGLDSDRALMVKYVSSGSNFALLAARHPSAVRDLPLYRIASSLRVVPFRTAFQMLFRVVAISRFMPLSVRGNALKIWRAFVYCAALPR